MKTNMRFRIKRWKNWSLRKNRPKKSVLIQPFNNICVNPNLPFFAYCNLFTAQPNIHLGYSLDYISFFGLRNSIRPEIKLRHSFLYAIGEGPTMEIWLSSKGKRRNNGGLGLTEMVLKG